MPDVNVLVYAHREDAPGHERYRAWLEGVLNSEASYGISDLVLSGFLRVVTHPRVFKTPTSLRTAIAFARAIRERPNCVVLNPDPRLVLKRLLGSLRAVFGSGAGAVPRG